MIFRANGAAYAETCRKGSGALLTTKRIFARGKDRGTASKTGAGKVEVEKMEKEIINRLRQRELELTAAKQAAQIAERREFMNVIASFIKK